LTGLLNTNIHFPLPAVDRPDYQQDVHIMIPQQSRAQSNFSRAGVRFLNLTPFELAERVLLLTSSLEMSGKQY
jgi:hypothetical protein